MLGGLFSSFCKSDMKPKTPSEEIFLLNYAKVRQKCAKGILFFNAYESQFHSPTEPLEKQWESMQCLSAEF